MLGPPKKYIPKKCPHSKRKSRCREGCGGSAYCGHGTRRSTCVACGGAEICQHQKRRSRCGDCNGVELCPHNKLKYRCHACGGSSVCDHGVLRTNCQTCDGGSICSHKRQRSRCRECHGGGICVHDRSRYNCKECHGNGICRHGNQYSCCTECGDGSQICITPMCSTRKNKRLGGDYCMRCHIHLFPGSEPVRNYKTKELAVVEYITTTFPGHQWVNDRRIDGACSRRRPDLFLDLGTHVLIIENDEFGDAHKTSCDNRRLMELSEDIAHRSMVCIRFNPDSYTNESGERVKSCWKANKQTGILVVPASERENWAQRLDALRAMVEHYLSLVDPPERTLTEEFLFFNEVVVEESGPSSKRRKL